MKTPAKWKGFAFNSATQALMQPMDGMVTEAIAQVALRSKIPHHGYYLIDVVDNMVKSPIQDPILNIIKWKVFR